ncbi:hypothetical protein [Legionella brunensis]|uniref:Uncharacterized protein n=1 Tax=Legionella brunensis TaxID=29422 RepID=A0A0W0SK56_9GAMM|nr:hypothetical protein [Legionella brunensis]KTC83783.1 hypothetical protein Lbru_1606 [Legionella brunensis]
MKVVIFSAGRHYEDWYSMPLEGKLNKLKEIIDGQFKNNNEFNTLVSENEGKLSGIFVMPEYALNQINEDFEVEPLTKSQIKQIETFIKNECSMDGLLIVPGTGLYQKSFTDDKRSHVKSKWEAFRDEHLHLYHGDNREVMRQMLEKEVGDVNTTGETSYRRNVIIAMNEGKKYSLRKIDSVTDTKEGTVFIPGIKTPSFQCMDKEVALYICNDVAQGFILQKDAEINIVVSDAINLLEIKEDEEKDNKTYLPKTMIIHACTKPLQCGVMLNGEMQPLGNTDETSFGEISTYHVELPSYSLGNYV